MSDQIAKQVAFCKVDEMKQIVYGEVYTPFIPGVEETVDTHGDAMVAEEVEKMAHNFMMKVQGVSKIDKQHNRQPGEAYIVESYIEKTDVAEIVKSALVMKSAGTTDEEIIKSMVDQFQLFAPGSWVMGTKVVKDETWQQVLNNEITGYSIDGIAVVEVLEEGGNG